MIPEYFQPERDDQNASGFTASGKKNGRANVLFLPSSMDEASSFAVLLLIFILCCLAPMFSLAVGTCRRSESVVVENGNVPIREVFSVDRLGKSYLVDINTANVHELRILPGIGKITAEKIVAEREANGPYRSVDDLTRVKGLGRRKVETIAEMIAPVVVPDSVAKR